MCLENLFVKANLFARPFSNFFQRTYNAETRFMYTNIQGFSSSIFLQCRIFTMYQFELQKNCRSGFVPIFDPFCYFPRVVSL